MKTAFMTLGCPAWDLDTVIRRAVEYGFEGVDLRGLKDEPRDVTLTQEFTTRINETKRKFSDAGLEVPCISSSIKLCVPAMAKENLEEAKRDIELCREMGIKKVRLFGGEIGENMDRAAAMSAGKKMAEAILELDGATEVEWLMETHDAWIKSADARAFMQAINSPSFAVLWDCAHTSRVAKEDPELSWKKIGQWVRYLHLKDASYDPNRLNKKMDGWWYCAPGEGNLPLLKGIKLLLDSGYRGWFTFEWEKRWHPDLPEPEEVFPKFQKWFRSQVEPLVANSVV